MCTLILHVIFELLGPEAIRQCTARSFNKYKQNISEADATTYRTARMPSYRHSISCIQGFYVFQFTAILLDTHTHTHTHI